MYFNATLVSYLSVGVVVGLLIDIFVWWLIAPKLRVPTVTILGSNKIKVSQALATSWSRVDHAICNVYPNGTDPAKCLPGNNGVQMMERKGTTSTWSKEFNDEVGGSDQFAIVWVYWYPKWKPDWIFQTTSRPSAKFTPR